MNGDILYDILSYIKTPKDLCCITRVCRLWDYVAINTTTWEAMSVLANYNILHFSIRNQLLFACQYGHLKIIQWLYSSCGLTIKDVRFNRNWALQLACEKGHLNVVRYLCETFGLTIEDVRSKDNQALRWAYRCGHLNVIQYLCQHFRLDYKREIRALYE